MLERVLGERAFPLAGSAPDGRLGRVRAALSHSIQSIAIANYSTTRADERQHRIKDVLNTLEQALVDVKAEELGLDVESIR